MKTYATIYSTANHKKSASLEESRQTIPESNLPVGQRSGFLVKQIEKIYGG